MNNVLVVLEGTVVLDHLDCVREMRFFVFRLRFDD